MIVSRIVVVATALLWYNLLLDQASFRSLKLTISLQLAYGAESPLQCHSLSRCTLTSQPLLFSMLTYSADSLLDLRRYDVKPPRRTRKTIFKYRLWLPRTQRNHPTYVKPTAQPANVGRKPGRSSRPTDTRWEEESAVSLYVFNAAGLAKPHAIEQLTADIASYQSDIAIVTETHFKAHGATNIPGYTLYRRDRTGRRGGGVAIYVRSTLQSASWTPDADDKIYKLQWTKVRDDFIGVLYHRPKPLYKTEMLLDYIESAVDEINTTYPGCLITLAGDFNQLTDRDIIE